jgi:hypothetical protein
MIFGPCGTELALIIGICAPTTASGKTIASSQTSRSPE